MKETVYHLKKIFSFGKQYKWFFLLELLLSCIQISIGVLLPLFAAKQIVLVTNNEYHQLLLISVAICGIEIFNSLNNACIGKVCNVFRRGTMKNIQIELGIEILKIKQEDIEKYGTGTFIERLNHDTERITELFTKGIGYLARVFTYLGVFISVLVINRVVFLYYLIVALLLTFLYLIKTKKIGIQDVKYKKQKDKVSGFIGELVRGEKDIKILSAKKSFMNRLSTEITKQNDLQHVKRNLEVLYDIGIHFLTSILTLGLVILLIFLIQNEQLSVSLAVALFTYKTNIMTNFMENVSLLLNEVKDFNISSGRALSILENKAFHKEIFGTRHLDHLEGNFSFENVSFSYKNYPVLNGMTFDIKAGQTVAFVGKSGAGKTTVFNLLGKLYDIENGEIWIDDINIQTLDEASIRDNITIISQNPYIFNMSIRDNFKLVKEDVKEEEIVEALKKSCLYSFVSTLPNGIDTIIGEGGTNLSGGQRQRLAIARAFVQKTKIILFDEATSALDNETQRDIQKAIDNLKGEYTIMIIAHRLSTIIHADRILLVEDGKITAEGTHQELLSNNVVYQKLYENEITK